MIFFYIGDNGFGNCFLKRKRFYEELNIFDFFIFELDFNNIRLVIKCVSII